MRVIQTNAAPAAIGPYSQGVMVGNLVFTSGQIPIAAGNTAGSTAGSTAGTGEVVGASVAEQTEQVIKNLTAVLEAAGSSLARVVKTTCFLADMNDFAAFNEVYAAYFTGKPARSTVAVKQLPKSVLVEIEAIAECS